MLDSGLELVPWNGLKEWMLKKRRGGCWSNDSWFSRGDDLYIRPEVLRILCGFVAQGTVEDGGGL